MTKKDKMMFVLNYFEKKFTDAKISLDYNTEYQLMVAVILSAQCTDNRVNIITKKLFEVVREPIDIYNMDIKTLEEYIKSAGFYHAKALNIKKGAKVLVEKYNGILPRNMEELVNLGGVGRKTANVLLHELWGINSGIVVDTHVRKLSNLLGFSKSTNPNIIEKDLMKITPKKYWKILPHYFIIHGRLRCIQKKLDCEVCDLIRGKNNK